MANRFTFAYGPNQPPAPGSTAPPSEILVTSGDRVEESVTMILRSIEFLRSVYCGGKDVDAFTVPGALVAGIEADNAVERRAASPSTAKAADRFANSIHVPTTTLPNRTLASARHTALQQIANLPFTSIPRKGGNASKEPSCAPFLLRVSLNKPGTGGFFGKRAETFEEWEFAFVKVKPSTSKGATPPGGELDGGSVSQTTFIGGASKNTPTPMQHALGITSRSSQLNDPSKLRDVMHFINQKAMVPMDFVVEELRVVPEVQFEVTVVPNDRNSAYCVPIAAGAASAASPASSKPAVADASAPSAVQGFGRSVASFWPFRGGQ